ncbi:hypothetical protein [uncultured Paracoccus sp.]|nr:hypothetical protein [uncultured Paracoccus sp.]
MTNRIAIFLGLLIALILAADLLFLGGNIPIFLAREFVGFVEYLSFWR